MKLIKNGNVLTMEDTDFQNGYLIIKEDKIYDVGDMNDFTYNESDFDEIYDAGGCTVMPGLIDAHCHVGMWEEGISFEGDDGNEDTDPITPQLRAIDAINPFDEAFSNALSAGITTVVTGPGSANVFGGQFAALKTYGNCVDKMIIKSPVAQKIALGENPKATYSPKRQMPATRMATAALVRETLIKAKEYKEAWDDYQKDNELDKPDIDFKLDSLLDVLQKKIPVKVHAHRADDICTAIRIKEEFDINITLEHCTEGHLICDILKEKNIPIMLGPTLATKSKVELKNMTFDSYDILSRQGIEFAIITDHPEIPIEYLPLCAALAVKNGMDKKKALKAITINAAKNTCIDDRVGSIKKGKDADLIIVENDILSLDAKITHIFLNGFLCKPMCK